MTVFCATTNPGKWKEFRAAATPGIDIQPMPGMSGIAVCEETGETFEANALQKAMYYGAIESGYLFAEDSGLEVDALGGAPGVYSARFAGTNATDEANNALLMDQMKGVADRRARYVCVIALVEDGHLLETFRGEVEGQIAQAPSGSGGFGYDPLFHYPEFGCTFAEVSAGRKQTVSHRGRALQLFMNYLERLAVKKPG